MKSLQELRSLVNLARKFGQEPSPVILEQIELLEKDEAQRVERENEIRGRIAEDLNTIFAGVKVEPGVSIPIKDVPGLGEVLERGINAGVINITGDSKIVEETVQPVPVKPETIVDKVAKVIKESSVVAPDPVLAQPQKNLDLEIKRLEKWISRIAAHGPGSGEVNFRYLDDIDRSSIDKNKYLTYTPAIKKFQFVDTRVSVEAFDRSSSIVITSVPQILKPNSVTNAKNIVYDTSTGVFTFITQCEISLAITVNALAAASGQRVYQYAERNTGSGWTPIVNSGKSFQLTNTQVTQIVNAQTISRLEGEQIRYLIYASSDDKVTLITETLPNVSSGTVYVPAIRIQYAGR